MISAPRIFLKVCCEDEVLRAALPARWSLRPPGWLMTCDVEPPPAMAAPDYSLSVDDRGAVRSFRVHDPAGMPAASSYATEVGGFIAFDRIETAPFYRRRGLGRMVMGALVATRRSPSSRPVLVATQDGRALYLSLGWRVRAPYATAVIEA